MNLLNLNIAKMAGPGRLPTPLDVEYVRDINEADLALMAIQPLGSVPPALKRITDRHHSLARLLASGVPDGEAALITGYDISRVSILKNSPAFQELLALYQSETRREFTSVLEHMAGVSRDALLELRERLEEDAARFSNADLVKVATEFIDRTVSGPEIADLPEVIELTSPGALDPPVDPSPSKSIRPAAALLLPSPDSSVGPDG